LVGAAAGLGGGDSGNDGATAARILLVCGTAKLRGDAVRSAKQTDLMQREESIMSPTAVFVSDLTLTVLVCAGIVLYVAKHLRSLLIELCGTAERANFWLAFSNVSLVLVPLIFALDYKPEFGPEKLVAFEMAAQLKYALIGFVATLASLAVILLWFIPREKPNWAAPAVK
jgi:hypothetical protein